jgi:ketosteroid isomerase-like protein
MFRDTPTNVLEDEMTTAADATQWAEEFFALVDAGDADGVAGRVSEGAVLITGNGEPVVGREEIRAAINGFQTMIGSLSHEIVRVWAVAGGYIAELRVSYVRLDGGSLVLPCTNIFDLDADGQITEYKIFMDMAPVFA